jgi:hypothetical protein
MDAYQVTIIVFIAGYVLLYSLSALTKTLWVFNGTMIRGAILGTVLVYLVTNSVSIFVSKFNSGTWTYGGVREGDALIDVFFIFVILWLWFHFAKAARRERNKSDSESI